MSLQLKLNLLITSLLLLLLSVSAYFIIENAREDVKAEVSSTSNLVLHLLDAEIVHYTSDFGWINHEIDGEMSIFKLKSLGNIRHLKIEFYDARGRLRESNRDHTSGVEHDAPPAWFVKAMDMSSLGVEERRKNVVLNGRYLGDLVVTPDPSYEIAEVWDDTVGLLALVGIFFILMNVLAYWAVRYTFNPVNQIISALTQVELGHYGSRLPAFKQVELQEIGNKFNAMADTLQQSTQNNHRLTQQIISLQEDERKSLARDIHDEIGQYLTAIHVDASAILAAKKISTAKESASAISNITRQMMDMVHELLQRLRPRVLDELGLGLALSEHIHHWRQRNRSVSIIQNVSGHLGGLDEAVAITAYRVVQECLTNITKHANARRLTISVSTDETHLLIDIEDDGVGFDKTRMTNRYGLAGMRERVQGLMGSMEIESAPNAGTRIYIRLPKHVEKDSSK
ncbi:MAG TPA: sensor histidine kinase [Methylotenera sp.]|nr:sensor histidine kinase [Methylotenera sp.]HPN02085.1 sensor histidine kinase [Methylotenera sp.]